MHTPELELGERGYDVTHIDEVLAAISDNFPGYWTSFAAGAKRKLREAASAWEDEHPVYLEFLDAESLHEYEDDPNAFKGAMRSKCPIIRRSLNSPAEEMKKYKIAFNGAKGRDLLAATANIVAFGGRHMEGFDDTTHELMGRVDELGLADLLREEYGVYGAIGGGIKSQFLFALHPAAFPCRSRAAVWAMYFLSGKDDFGFVDGSEFLMINVDKSSTQQNYFYPYDLFAFYSLKVYGMLRDRCAELNIELQGNRRYVYLDAFYNYIADQHQKDLSLLKGIPEDEYVD